MRALTRFWILRSPTERRVIVAGALVVAALLLFTFAWLPLERSRARDAAALPGLRAALATMEADARTVKRLRALPARDRAPSGTLAALAASNPIAGTQVTTLDDRRIRVSAADASFATLLEGLGRLGASHGLHVESARLEALPAPGRVSGELILARP